MGQGFAQRLSQGGDICRWRLPDSSELNASVMLALAHGSKGIMFWHFSPNGSAKKIKDCGVNQHMWFDGIVYTNLTPTDLYWYIKDGLSPRLKGKLGKTLLSLDYTGNYINKECYNCPNQDNITTDYLTINHYGTNYYWHAGFLNQHNYADNKYFLLANLRTTLPVTASLTVENNIGYNNVSFTDIERGVGRVDTTIGLDSSITYLETMPAGEGRLYRVSPVVLYGGRLIYDENAGEGQILTDEMTIENGATLTVYGTYTAEANIIVKNGSIVNGENGKIIFKNGTKLIIEGTATINGTSEDKLTLKFESDGQEPQNGILINPIGLLTISNCIIDGAETGIKAELYAKYLNAQYVDCISGGKVSNWRFNYCFTNI